jgi:hypothetical protein
MYNNNMIINKENNKSWQGDGEKGNILHCWWECNLVHPLWEFSIEVHQKVKNKPTLLPGYITWLYIQRIVNQYTREIHAQSYSLQHYIATL